MLDLLASRWRAVALRGALAILFGTVALAWPAITAEVLVVAFGVYGLIDGILAVATALGGPARRDRWVVGVEGLLNVAAGGVVGMAIDHRLLALVLVIAAWAVATGLTELAAAVRLRQELDHEWFLAISGASSVAVGALLGFRPSEAVVAVAWLVGAFAVGFGGLLLGLALRLRAAARPATGDPAADDAARFGA